MAKPAGPAVKCLTLSTGMRSSGTAGARAEVLGVCVICGATRLIDVEVIHGVRKLYWYRLCVLGC